MWRLPRFIPFATGTAESVACLHPSPCTEGGFRRKEFTSLEEWWGRHVADYYEAFGCLGREFDDAADVTPFIDGHVRAQLSQVRALDLRERVERRIWEALEEIVDRVSLQPRLVNALWDAFFERSVTPAYYTSVADVSRATATIDLAAAVAAGLMESRRGSRARHYVATADLFDRVGQVLDIELPQQNQRARIVSVLSGYFTQTGA